MPLSKTQRSFLTQALKVNVKKKIIGKNVNEKATASFDRFSSLEDTTIELVKELKGLPYSSSLVTLYEDQIKSAQNVAKSAPPNDPEAAEEKFKEATLSLTGTKEPLEAHIRDIKKFVTEKAKADELRRTLTALKREGTPDYDIPLHALIGDAEKSATNGKFQEAIDKLKPAKSTFDREKKKAEQDQKDALHDARNQPVYEDKRRRIEEGLAYLKDLPGTEAQRQELQELLDAGEDAEDEDFKKAYKKLEGLRGTLKEAEKASQRFVESVGGPALQKERQAAEDNLAKYEELANLSDPTTIAEKRKEIDATLKGLEGTPDQNAITQATAKLKTIAKELGDKLNVLDVAKKQADPLRETLRKAITIDLARVCGPDVCGPFLQRFQTASSLLGAQDYVEALAQFISLETDVASTYKPLETTYKDYDAVAKDARSRLAKYEQAQEMASNYVSQFASRLHGAFLQAENDLRTTHDYSKAKPAAQAIIDNFAELEKRMQAYQDGEAELSLAKKRVFGQVDFVVRAIKVLTDAGGDGSTFTDALEKAKDDFNHGIMDALDPTKARVNVVEAACMTALGKIVTDVNAILNDPTQLANSKTSAEGKARATKFSQLQGSIKQLLVTLGQDNRSAVGPFQTRLTGAQPGGTGVTEQLVKDLEKLETDIKNAMAANNRTIDTEHKAAVTKAKALLKEIDTLQKANKSFAGYLDTLRDEVNTALGMTESTVLAVVLEGKQALTTIEGKINGVKTGNAKGSTAPDTFAAVDNKLKAMEKELNEKLFKDCVPSEQKLLMHRVKNELPGVVKGMAPAEALSGPLTEFQGEIDKARDRATKAQTRRTNLQRDGATALTELKALEGAPKLKASLEARIKSCMNPAENTEATTELDLKVIRNQIKDAIAHPDKRTLMEQQLVTAEFENEKAEETWKAAVDVFKKNGLRDLDAAHDETPKKDRDEGRYKDVRALLAEAEKLADKGNFILANEKLAEARRTARDYVANPYGAKATARNNLKAALGKWKTVVGNYIKELNAIKKAITDEAKSDPTVTPKPALDAIDKVMNLFDPIRFDRDTEILEAEDANIGQRRRAKEICLRYVRQYQAQLKSDPVLNHLVGGPFRTAFSTTAIADRLRDLETNFLRAEDR